MGPEEHAAVVRIPAGDGLGDGDGGGLGGDGVATGLDAMAEDDARGVASKRTVDERAVVVLDRGEAVRVERVHAAVVVLRHEEADRISVLSDDLEVRIAGVQLAVHRRVGHQLRAAGEGVERGAQAGGEVGDEVPVRRVVQAILVVDVDAVEVVVGDKAGEGLDDGGGVADAVVPALRHLPAGALPDAAHAGAAEAEEDLDAGGVEVGGELGQALAVAPGDGADRAASSQMTPFGVQV
nr:hypothetical protein [Nannocystis sp.]